MANSENYSKFKTYQFRDEKIVALRIYDKLRLFIYKSKSIGHFSQFLEKLFKSGKDDFGGVFDI